MFSSMDLFYLISEYTIYDTSNFSHTVIIQISFFYGYFREMCFYLHLYECYPQMGQRIRTWRESIS